MPCWFSGSVFGLLESLLKCRGTGSQGVDGHFEKSTIP